jgi:hypothetical protein
MMLLLTLLLGTALARADSAVSAHVDRKNGFELSYPADWKQTAKPAGACKDVLPGVFSAAGSGDSGEPGAGEGPCLTIQVWAAKDYRPAKVEDYGGMKPLPRRGVPVSLGAIAAQRFDYETGGPECELVDIRQYEIKRGGRILVLDFRNSLAGYAMGCCSTTPERCESSKGKQRKAFESAVQGILNSLRFP